MKIHTKQLLQLAGFVFLIALFCYFRLKPIYFQTVPYTYDQGRDFLKAAEIVMYKNLTFIGPTTGIPGIFHGAWWYYLLTIPFILFSGLPIGFYYFIFFLHLLTFIALFWFFLKKYNFIIAFLMGLLIATSPYFIFSSFFASNDNMVLPVLTLFLISNFLLLENKLSRYIKIVFLTGLSLGLIAEFEFAFGLLLIPVYLFLSILFKNLRSTIWKGKNSIVFIGGLLIAFLPRILFELKHHFEQTLTLIHFIIKPKYYTPHPFLDTLHQRSDLFQRYYERIFANDILMWIISGSILIAFALFLSQKNKKNIQPFLFFISLLFFLFIASTVYKDTFWDNYYQGLPYIMIFIIASFLSLKSHWLEKINIGLCIVVACIGLTMAYQDSIKKNNNFNDGLIAEQKIVDYIVNQQGQNINYCVSVYTAPVIPYTYNYLFLYHSRKYHVPEPQTTWTNDKCWYVLEKDDFIQRKEKWIKDHIPDSYRQASVKKIGNATVELWEK